MKKLDEDELRLRIENALKGNKRNISQLQIDQLIEEVNVYHKELEYQNEELKRAQFDLEESNNRYKSLFADAPTGYLLCDEDFMIRDANNAFYGLIRAHQSVINQPISSYVHPRWQDEFFFIKQQISKNKQISSHEISLNVDNAEVPVKISVNRQQVDGETVYRFAFSDLSVEKKYERHLTERIKELDCLYSFSQLLQNQNINIDELLQSAVELIPAAMQFPEFVCARIKYNEKEYRTFQFDTSDIKISSSLKIKTRTIGFLEVMYKSEKGEKSGYKFIKEERKLIDNLANRLGDYLERRLIELAVFQSNENLRITLKSIGDAVIATDIQGRITQMNIIAERLTGWSQQEAFQKNLDEVFKIVHAVTGDKAENPVYKVLETGSIVGLANHTKLISKSGEEFHIADSGAPIKDELGNIQGVVLVFRDVSHDYKIRQELIESEQELKTAQRIGKTGSWRFHLNTGLVSVSEESCRIYGLDVQKTYTIDEIKTFPLPKYRPLLDSAMKNLIENGGEYDMKFEIERPSDHKIVFIHSLAQYDSNENTILGIIHDISEQHEAQQALNSSNEKLRITLQSIGDAVIATDLEGRITQMNSIAEQLTGWNLHDALGAELEQVFRIINSQTGQKAENPAFKVLETGSIVGLANHTKLIAKNGTEFHIADSGAPIKDGNGNIQGVVLVFRDVTQEYQMRQQLIESEERFSKLFKNSPVPKALSFYSDARIVDVNDAWVKYFGFEKDEALGKTPSELGIYHWAFQENIIEEIKQKGKVENSEIEIVTKERKQKSVLASMELTELNGISHLIAVFADITEIREAEKALMVSEGRFRSFVENANDIIYQVSPDGVFTYTSPNWTQILGYEVHEVIGSSLYKFVHPDDVNICLDYLNQIMSDNKSSNSVEYRVLHKNGDWRWHSSTGAALRNELGFPVSYLGVARDITELKEALIKQNETMQIVSAAFNAVDSFLAVIDKDFKIVLSNWHGINWGESIDNDDVFCCYKSLKKLDKPCADCPPMLTLNDGKPRFFEEYNPDTGEYKEVSVMPVFNDKNEVQYVLENVRDVTKRKDAEKSNLELYHRYQTIISNFPNGAVFMFNKELQCTHVDGKLLGESGLATEHFLGKRPDETLPPEVASVIIQNVPILFKNQTCYYETELLGKTMANWGEPIINSDGIIEQALVFSIDITQLKENERQIKESEERFSLLVRNLQSGIFYVNTRGEVLETNPALIKLLGSPSEEATKKINIFEFKPLVEFGYTQKLQQCIDEGHIVYGEGNYITKWGKNIYVKYYFVPIFNNGKVTGALASLEDTTRQKTDALKIENAEKRFRALIENAPDGLNIVSLEGTMIYISPNSLRLFGYEESEVINHLGSEFVHPDDVSTVIKVFEEIANFPERKPTISYRFRRKSGEYRWIETTFANLLNDEAIGGFVLNFTDITERRVLIENLVKAKEKAEENDNLKSAFLANMSHEIRTPMNGIIGFTSLLSEPDITKEERQQFLSLIEKAGHKLMSTVNDLIDISKIETGQMPVAWSSFGIKESVENMYDFYKAEAKIKGLDMVLSLNEVDDCTHIKTDPMKFESIFTNLLKNSIKYTDSGRIEIGCILKERFIEFHVKDSGIGIPADRQEAVFNRFEQAKFRDKHAIEGSGLGLAICKAYVEMLGGKIWLESEENVGSTFYFTLPLEHKPN